MSVLGTDGERRSIERFEGPRNVEGGIVPEDRTLTCGVVEIGSLIEDLSCVGEDEKAVGKAFGDPYELEFVCEGLGFEVESGPFAEVGRVAAEVDGDIPDVTGEDTDELALGMAELVVQAAEDALAGEGLVVLDELGGKAGGGKA